MIELLVVIAVIGVLAVAVLSSINPIEQINKGRDTRSRSDAAQLISAVDRYYAIHEIYPWNAHKYVTALTTDTLPDIAFPDGVACAGDGAAGEMCDITALAANQDWLSGLTDTQEVKDSFVTRIAGDPNPLLVQKAAVANATMYVCFAPTSRAFQQEAMKDCSQKGDEPAAACSQGTPGDVNYTDSYDYVDEMICLP